MKFKLKATELRKQLISGQLPEQRPQLALALSWVLNFLLGMIMSTAVILESFGPFGIAAVAQAGVRISGLMCTLGASAGYLLTFGFEKGIKYVAAVVLVFTAGYVFQELKVYKRIWFMPAIAAFFTLLSGFLGAVDSLGTTPVYMPLLTETILAGGGAYFFREALSTAERDTESSETRHGISIIILLACMMISLSRINIAGVLSLGRLAAVLIVMTAAFKGGALSGAAAGAALGIAMDIAAGGTPYYSTAYAFSGLKIGRAHV